MIIIYTLLGLLAILIIFMIIRTLLVKPKALKSGSYEPLVFDKQSLANNLSKAVKIPTITMLTEDMNGEAFLEYHAFLEKTYPIIFKNCKKTIINNYSLILRIDGSDETLLPGAFLAHQDVVPAPVEGWEVPPFEGTIKDGFVYGRGSQDMKGQMIAMLEALENLLSNGFKPKRTMLFCFGHDEEYTGKEGAKNIAKHLQEQNIKLEFVIDEGGVILDGKMLGINGMIALIGTCEKGYLDLELKASKSGGHASMPTSRTALGLLAEAIYSVESNPMKTTWSTPVKELFKELAPYMKHIFKFLFVNRDILSPLLKLVLSKNSVTNSLMRTTFSPTQAKGAGAPNVLPPFATATINCRTNIGETSDDVIKYVKSVVGNKIEVNMLPGMSEPTPVSDITTDAYRKLASTINQVFPNYMPAPYPFVAATDAKYYYTLTNNVYRFTPFMMSESDRSRLHAINERLNIDSLELGAQFFAKFMKNTCGD